MKNVELKVKIKSATPLVKLLKKMGAQNLGKLNQVDTYYNYKRGRLKIREINKSHFELIFYKRLNKKSSKISDYKIVKLAKNQMNILKSSLKKKLGEKVIIKKQRALWIYKNTRIHLDKVRVLGNFLELETVVKKNNIDKAKKEHKEVTNFLNISNYKKLGGSYADLAFGTK